MTKKYMKYSLFSLQTGGLSLHGSMLMEAGEMCAVMWLPVTCRFPCVSEYICSIDTPARPALAELQGPFQLGSAPLSCICRQLYLDVGTNTFLPAYEVQLTEEAYRHQCTLTLKSLLNLTLVHSRGTLHNPSNSQLRLWIHNSSPQLASLICDVPLLLIIFPELLPAQGIHTNAF